MTSATKKSTTVKKVKSAPKTVEIIETTGSPQAQVAIMTTRINEITGHLKTSPKDHMARRGLLQLVGKRRRQLTYLAKKDAKAYLATIKKLGLRR